MDFNGWTGICLGKYFSHALRDADRFNSTKENGSLYGNFQLLYRDSSDHQRDFRGPIVSGIFGKMAIDYIVVGGICMLLGAVLTMVLLNLNMIRQRKLKKKLSRYILKLITFNFSLIN